MQSRSILALLAAASCQPRAVPSPSPSHVVSSAGDAAICPTTEDESTPRPPRPDEGVCDERHRDDVVGLLLAQPAPRGGSTPTGWDRKTTPEYQAVVQTALGLTDGERARIGRDGFVVSQRLEQANYAYAYADIHRGQLPVFVSADSILHAVYKSQEYWIELLENGLEQRLARALAAMESALVLAGAEYPPAVARDLDIYLAVARQLLSYDELPLPDETAKVVAPLVQQIREASGIHEVDVFGRKRPIDMSQFTPRGHYTGNLSRYFQTAMWMSRVELWVASPDGPIRSREPVAALALADLARRSGAFADLDVLDRAWAILAGRREDVAPHELLRRATGAGISKLTAPDVASRLRAAIGNDFRRTVNTQPSGLDERRIAVATPLGARITVDTISTGTVARGRADELAAGDVAYILGHDRAAAYSRAPKSRLVEARAEFARAPASDDLYAGWLAAIRALAVVPGGALPSFMTSTAYADLRLDTAITAYGQLRHAYVLMAAQIVERGGCEIPDGYVEPAIDTYRALATLAARTRAAYAIVMPDAKYMNDQLVKIEKLMQTLVALSREELANRPLSDDAKRFLAMIVEQRDGFEKNMYGAELPAPTFDGWYFDLFPDVRQAFESTEFLADYATFITGPASGGVHYIGARRPRLGVFVVDTGGQPRMMVGPVAHGFEATTFGAERLTDADIDRAEAREPWSASYTLPVRKGPTVQLEYHAAATRPPKMTGTWSNDLGPNIVRIHSDAALGDATIELLDHHFVPMATVPVRIGTDRTDVVAPAVDRRVEALRLRIGAFQTRIDLAIEGYTYGTFETHDSGGP